MQGNQQPSPLLELTCLLIVAFCLCNVMQMNIYKAPNLVISPKRKVYKRWWWCGRGGEGSTRIHLHTHTLSLCLSHTHTHTHARARARTHAHMYTHTYTHTHTHTDTHTQTHTDTHSHTRIHPPPLNQSCKTQVTMMEGLAKARHHKADRKSSRTLALWVTS